MMPINTLRSRRCSPGVGVSSVTAVSTVVLMLALVCHLSESFSVLPSLQQRRNAVGVNRPITFPQPAVKAAADSTDSSNDSKTDASPSSTKTPPPVLNGKMVLPYTVLSKGLAGHTMYGVYAILNGDYKRGKSGEGWQHVEYVAVADSDLAQSLASYQYTNSGVDLSTCHVRALSFSFPQRAAMQEVAEEWKTKAQEAEAPLSGQASEYDIQQTRLALMKATSFLDDEEDDDDDADWELDDDMDMAAMASVSAAAATATVSPTSVTSPFEKDTDASASSATETSPPSGEAAKSSSPTTPQDFSLETVDKILDEIRPYLINDGGNVSVERVEPATKDVYLRLEGACGSCPSSTVTMQMGIERVLKEHYSDLGQVIQVTGDEDGSGEPEGLTYEAVEQEVRRISQAIIAMGGVVRIQNVDTDTGAVQIFFRGSNKVQQGLELALLDVPHLKHVEFVSQE